MVGTLLGLPRPPKSDHAADALAVAICHAGHARPADALAGMARPDEPPKLVQQAEAR
jgi:Holliday junction resolvasome RuvABC endonuclease subunit